MHEPSISLMSVLLATGAAQCLFLSIVLVRSEKANKPANRFLTAILFVFSLSLIDGFLAETNYYELVPGLIGFEWPTNFLYGPLIFLYVKSVTGWQTRHLKKLCCLHFIPAAAFFIYMIPFYLMDPQKKALWWAMTGGVEKADSVLDLDPIIILIVAQMAVYIALSLRILTRHAAMIEQNFSSVEEVNLSWLRKLLALFLFLWFIYAFFALFSSYFDIYRQTGYLLHLLCAGAIFVLGYKGLRQPAIFTIKGDDEPDETPGSSHGKAAAPVLFPGEPAVHGNGEQKSKYRKSSLDDELAGDILDALLYLMREEKPYLEMGLTLSALSNMLSVSTNHISQVINMKLEKNFFDFVNEYRVEEAKRLLVSPQSAHLSILGIGMDAGFSSKSAFYNAFRKHAGMTPSQYKDRQSKTA